MQTLQNKIEEGKEKLKAVKDMSNNQNVIRFLELAMGYADLALKEME